MVCQGLPYYNAHLHLTFIKVVKYWDEFSNGGDGSKVLEENGPGISKDAPGSKDGGDDSSAAEEAGEGDEAAGEGEEEGKGEEGDEAAAEGTEDDAADETGMGQKKNSPLLSTQFKS